jgi:F-type H+-transporting ATPase subunit k
MATLGAVFGGSWLATRGGNTDKQQGPPINASSKEEEQFIQYVCRFSSIL